MKNTWQLHINYDYVPTIIDFLSQSSVENYHHLHTLMSFWSCIIIIIFIILKTSFSLPFNNSGWLFMLPTSKKEKNSSKNNMDTIPGLLKPYSFV